MKTIILVSLIASVAACNGCSSAQQQQALPGGEQLVACVLPVVAIDVAKGDPWEICVADAVAKCGATAIQVSQIWAAHVRAESIEGNMVRMPVPDGGKL